MNDTERSNSSYFGHPEKYSFKFKNCIINYTTILKNNNTIVDKTILQESFKNMTYLHIYIMR